MDDWIWILIAVAAVLVLVLVLVVVVARVRQRRRTGHLRARFGPEYDTTVHRLGRNQGERHLEQLLHDHDRRRIRDVSPEERDAALRSWEAVQTSFVESPVSSVREADQLVFSVLRERGYPLESVDERASALSVEEPELAHRYRDAHAALARAEGTAPSEGRNGAGADVSSLREALLTYRDLLFELVDAPRVTGRLTTGSPDAPSDRSGAVDGGVEPGVARGADRAADGGADGDADRGPDARTISEEESWTSTRTDRT